jgi:hypothetical protein
LNYPEHYSFLDISNHNAQKGQVHFETGSWVWRKVQESGQLRPVNCVKIYGSDGGRIGNGQDGLERFWRNIFAGMAASRFHRPPAGLGLSEIAQAHIKSMRMLTDELGIFSCQPHNDLLGDRSDNEAFCLADPGRSYAVVFLDGGNCSLDVATAKGELGMKWLNIMSSEWQELESLSHVKEIKLTTPTNGFWAVLISTR